jgi:hypothetical protein
MLKLQKLLCWLMQPLITTKSTFGGVLGFILLFFIIILHPYTKKALQEETADWWD